MVDTKRNLLIAQCALLSPALLFLTAVAIQMTHPMRPAQEIVLAYAGKMWTLWVLLIALPLAVLVSGGALLLRYPRLAANGAISRWTKPLLRTTTGTAAAILMIVALHMAAN